MSRLTASPRRLAAARPATAPRVATAPLAALVALAAVFGCRAGPVIEECPGLEVAVLDLEATRSSAACQADSVPTDGTAACAARAPPVTANCLVDRPVPPCCFDGLFKPTVRFRATIAFGQLDDSAAFCLPVAGATPYTGTRTTSGGSDTFSVSLETAGAVLASCSSTCAVTVRHEVTGVLTRDPVSGAVTGFTGQSVEAATATPAATCAPCTAPCTATWSLARVQAPAP